MRRVSSQATRSASRSAASTRRVTSSRLPIGVGQTIRRPALTPSSSSASRRPRGPSKASAAAPIIPDSTPNRAATIAHRRPAAAAAPAGRPRLGPAASSSSPAAITPPPITTTSGLKMLTRLAIAIPSREPISSIASIAAGSPSWASSVTSGPASSRPSPQRAPEARVGLLAGRFAAPPARAPSPTRRSRRSRGSGQLPWQRGPSKSITMCPSSAAAPIDPR